MNGNLALELRMRSRSLAAFALTDPNTDSHFGVVVFESDEEEVREGQQVAPVDCSNLRQALNERGVGKLISLWIQILSPLEPDPEHAKRMGY